MVKRTILARFTLIFYAILIPNSRKHVYWPCSMTKCKHILNWNSILDFFKWTHKIKQESETCAP